MKNRKHWIGIAILSGAVIFTACNENGLPEVTDDLASIEKNAESATAEPGDSCVYGEPGSCCAYDGVLTDADIEGIMEMREEEKLARDVYLYFYEMYDHIVFKNISKSEEAHTSAVLRIIGGYELIDPATEEVGVFTNPLFTELYSQLTEQGSASLTEALKVGAFIEEYDINDLNGLIEETENADLERVYSNLLRGSTFHLRAFSRILDRMGESYTPVVITEEYYNELLNTELSDDEDGVADDPDWECPYLDS